jgi:hypothetical protein
MRFDLWTKQRKKYGAFALWEPKRSDVNIVTRMAVNRTIFNCWRKPRIFTFHIFSPYRKSEKEYCSDEVEKPKNEYPRKLSYKQIDIRIPRDRFRRMLNASLFSQTNIQQNNTAVQN